MPKYIVGKKSIISGSTLFKEGDTIYLTEDQAERHGLEPAGKKPAAPPADADKDKKQDAQKKK